MAAFLAAGVACERAETPAEPRASATPVSSSVPSALEPCRLLTLDEASAFLRGRATASPYERLTYASSCIWEARDPRRGLQVTTSTATQLRTDESMRAAGVDTPHESFARLVESQTAKGDGTPISSLGDAALWSEKEAQLWILDKDRALVTVSFHGERREADVRERCVEVARKIVPRI